MACHACNEFAMVSKATVVHERSRHPNGRIKWIEYRFGIARYECRAYMLIRWADGTVVNMDIEMETIRGAR